MAASATISLAGRITGEPAGSHSIGPLFISSAAANFQVQVGVLASGDNTVTVPTNIATSGVIIVLPQTNTQLVKVKGVGGDTGVAIGKTGFFVLNWESGNAPATFILNSAGTQTGLTTQMIFF